MSSPSRVLGALQALYSLMGPPGDVDAPTREAWPYRDPGDTPRGRAPLADLYRPDGPGPHPAILWVHGGGFAVGSRRMKPMRLLGTACRRAGLAAVTFDYRLLFRGGDARTGVDDVRAAWAYVVAEADTLGLDRTRLSLGGLSAGGCLALLAAPTLDPAPQRLVGVFPLYDFETLRGGPAGLLARLAAGSDATARRALSPLHAEHMPTMPTLLQHGTADMLIAAADAERYAARRRAAGLPTELRLYPDAPHAYHNAPESPAARQATADLLAFLGR